MHRTKFGLLIVFLTAFSLGGIGQTKAPLAAARSFYAFDRSHSDVLTRRAVIARKKWLSDELYRLFLNEIRRQKAYLRKNPHDKPYFGDGLSFTPIDETCVVGGKGLRKQLTVKAGSLTVRTANVSAIFAFPKPCGDPDTTIYTVSLIKVRNTWLIDDVLYEDKSSLKQALKRKDY